ncbi:MAG: PilN domain-containing protein [Deltaproteobacteria bacterium]|nr:PilN domain-containing protein [Deltaproteobacteria bacterium]
MGRKILGLDIRTNTISAVLLTNSIKGNVIESYSHFSLEPNTEESGAEKSSALKAITDKINVSDVVCIASFPAEDVSYRNIRIPFREPKKIRQVLSFELEPTLPSPIEEAVIDFQQLTLPKQQYQTGIIAAVIEKTKLDEYLAELASFRINPQAVTIGGYSTALCLARLLELPNHSVIIDVDPEWATLFAVSAGQVQIVRSITLSSSSKSPVRLISRGILQTVSAAEDMLGIDFSPEVIYLTGAGENELNIGRELSDLLDLPVKKIDLAQEAGITVTEQAGRSWIPDQMDNALSLAVSEVHGSHGLNFSKRQFAGKKQWIAHKKDITKTGILAGIILLILLFNVSYGFYSMSKKKNDLDFQITTIFKETFPEVTRIVDPLQQMRVKVKEVKQQSMIPGEAEKNFRIIDILNDISRLLPGEMDIDLSRLVVGPENVTLSGDTATFNSVDDMKNRLEKGPLFKKVSITSANSDKTGKRINFKLKIQF